MYSKEIEALLPEASSDTRHGVQRLITQAQLDILNKLKHEMLSYREEYEDIKYEDAVWFVTGARATLAYELRKVEQS